MIPPNINNAAKAQKNILGVAVLLLVSVTVGAFSAYTLMSNKQAEALNKCQDEKNQIVRDVMIQGGLIKDTASDAIYKRITDSVTQLITNKLKDKEITETK